MTFGIPAFAMPQFLELFLADPFHRPGVDGCITCHMSPEGGDARNPFGQAFESGGEIITPMLRAQFPDRFVYPVSRVNDGLVIHFSDPANKQIVVESGAVKALVDVEKKMVDRAIRGRLNARARRNARSGFLVSPRHVVGVSQPE